MSLESLRQRLSTTTRRTHRGTEDDVLNDHERLLLLRVVIPSTVILPLSDELDRWLGTVGLLLGHVQIINEDDESLSSGWSIDTLAPLLK